MRVKEIGLRQKTPSKHQPTSQNGEFKVENGLQTSFGDSRVAPSLKHRAYLWKWRNKEIEIKTLSNFRGARKKNTKNRLWECSSDSRNERCARELESRVYSVRGGRTTIQWKRMKICNFKPPLLRHSLEAPTPYSVCLIRNSTLH